jgi:hypothetical protein
VPAIAAEQLPELVALEACAKPDQADDEPPAESPPATPRKPRKPRARARVCRDWAYRDVDALQDLGTAQARGMTHPPALPRSGACPIPSKSPRNPAEIDCRPHLADGDPRPGYPDTRQPEYSDV